MESPVVKVNEGKIKGCILDNTVYGEKILGYLGIPYAKPPIGELRFKAPLPIEPWSGIKACTNDSHTSLQVERATGNVVGSEDCLYVNVYTKSVKPETPKPVIAHIHGGAFGNGSNSLEVYGPDYLLTEDIVLVTINYRLGMLAFLALDDTNLEVPGNAGLKDQALALKWIKNNIENFGGDPNNITLLGESAGSTSVHYQVLSPTTKGLFHKAICLSGVALNPWAIERTSAVKIVKVAGYEAKDEKDALEYLRKLPADEIGMLQKKFKASIPHNGIVFAPTIEKPNPTAFITELPYDLITSGRYNKVPLILRYCNREGLLWELLPAAVKLPERPLEVHLSIILKLSSDSEIIRGLAEKARKLYLESGDPEGKVLLDTDVNFLAGISESAKLHAINSNEPVYLSEFALHTSINYEMNKVDYFGAAHWDDIGYLFKIKALSNPKIGSIEDTYIKRSVKLIVNFAKTSNPTPPDCELGVNWKPVEPDALHYLSMGEDLTCRTNPEAERLRLWQEFTKSYRQLRVDYIIR